MKSRIPNEPAPTLGPSLLVESVAGNAEGAASHKSMWLAPKIAVSAVRVFAACAIFRSLVAFAGEPPVSVTTEDRVRSSTLIVVGRVAAVQIIGEHGKPRGNKPPHLVYLKGEAYQITLTNLVPLFPETKMPADSMTIVSFEGYGSDSEPRPALGQERIYFLREDTYRKHFVGVCINYDEDVKNRDEVVQIITKVKKWTTSDLSEHFTRWKNSPNRGAVDGVRDVAYGEMRQRGLLKRGKSREEFFALLGEPSTYFPKGESDGDWTFEEWRYPLNNGGFGVQFGPGHKATDFVRWWDGENPWEPFSTPRRLYRWNEVKKGMTGREVYQLLWEPFVYFPNAIPAGDWTYEEWRYSLNGSYLGIQFGPDRRVSGFVERATDW